MSTPNRTGHIRLTSHPNRTGGTQRFPIRWGAATARERGPVVGTVNAGTDRNAIGAHGGSYALYRALAVSSGAMSPIARPDLTNTSPVVEIGPFPQWSEPNRIVSLDPVQRPDLHNTSPAAEIGPFPQWSEPGRIVSIDPWGHRVAEDFKAEIGEGVDIRPSIAITKARLTMHELNDAVVKGRLKVDGTVMKDTGEVAVTKAAVEPVWYLPDIAERFLSLIHI